MGLLELSDSLGIRIAPMHHPFPNLNSHNSIHNILTNSLSTNNPTDCRVLLDNDALLEAGITDAVEQYNNEQFMTGRIPGKPYQVLVSEHGQIDQGRYIDPKSHMSFLFDHIKHVRFVFLVIL